MRVPQLHNRDREFGTMTPMIDVVFLLLIFFVVTASGQIRESLLPTDLATAGVTNTDIASAEPEPLQVEVWLKLMHDASTSHTRVDMNGTVYENLAQLKAQLRTLAELGPENPVILDIERNVPLGDVVDVYDTCQAAGFHSVSFAADAPVNVE